MTTNVKISLQMRGPSVIRHGILCVGLKTETECKRFSFKLYKHKMSLQKQEWDPVYKKLWDEQRQYKDDLTKIEMESYDADKSCQKIVDYFDNLTKKYDEITITTHPENIGALSGYIDYHLGYMGYFRNSKFKHVAWEEFKFIGLFN